MLAADSEWVELLSILSGQMNQFRLSVCRFTMWV